MVLLFLFLGPVNSTVAPYLRNFPHTMKLGVRNQVVHRGTFSNMAEGQVREKKSPELLDWLNQNTYV